jgi:hypothetical protein
MPKPVPPRGKLDELSDHRAILTLSGKFIEDEGARLPLRHKIMRNRIAFAQEPMDQIVWYPNRTQHEICRDPLHIDESGDHLQRNPAGISVDRRPTE